MKFNWTERQQVLAIIVLAGIALFLLWFFLLIPMNSQRRQIERDVQTMSAQLAQKDYLRGEDGLRQIKAQEEDRYAQYRRQLDQTLSSLSILPDQDALTNAIGHIDFKVALFDVRRRLRKQSDSMGIRLPHDLGIDESVNSTEDARKLMLQLRAVEEMVKLFLDLKIRMIQNIDPLPPAQFASEGGKFEFLEEYPVRVAFSGSTSNLYELCQAMLQPEHTFVLRNLRVEKTSPSQPDLLDVYAVLGALVFREFTNELVAASETTPTVSAPTGD